MYILKVIKKKIRYDFVRKSIFTRIIVRKQAGNPLHPDSQPLKYLCQLISIIGLLN